MEEKYFDVIICGAGPSGNTCALALADSGLQVAVIEKHSFPREKVCGDAIAAYVPKVLNTINPKYREAAIAFKEKEYINTCRLFMPNGKHIDVVGSAFGFTAQRMHWDNFLYELAAKEENIHHFLNHEIKDVIINKEKGEVSVIANNTVFKAKVVVGCDGAHSVVNKKTAGTKPDLNHYSGAVRAYYNNVTGIPKNSIELHFIDSILPGYFWIFPIKDGKANVGIGALSSEISKKKMNLKVMMEDIIKNHPAIKERFKDATLIGKIEGFGLPLSSRKVQMTGDHFILCGDAASLIDPASGEGIGQAMASGRYAGWQIKKCFKENDFSATCMKQYDDWIYDKFWKTSQKSHFFQKYFFTRKWLLNLCGNLITRSKLLQRLAMKLAT